MEATAFMVLAAACAPLVDSGTARALVQVESAFNPHAIGVVGGQLQRQPRTRDEAVATARSLQADGRSFSVGLAQINVQNFGPLGLTVASAFEPCTNLQAMQRVLLDCFRRARAAGSGGQRALRQALSCYYSGNFITGVEHGYTRRVVQAAASSTHPLPVPLRSTKEPA